MFCSEGRPSCSFLSDYTIAYFAKIWPYFVASDSSEQHKTQLVSPLQSDTERPALAFLLYTFSNHDLLLFVSEHASRCACQVLAWPHLCLPCASCQAGIALFCQRKRGVWNLIEDLLLVAHHKRNFQRCRGRRSLSKVDADITILK